MKLADVIREVRTEYYASMDKIEAIKLVGKLTGQGLRQSKDFFEWMDANGDGVSATELAKHWCEEHWQDKEICGCPGGVEVVADESELQAGEDATNGGAGTEAEAVVVPDIREVMPEIAVDPVWIATNQRTLHEAVGIALIAAGRQDVWESWHDSMREKYGYPTQWNGETLMGEAKKIVRKCGRKWKECKAEYDKRLAEMLTLRQRRR